jgi:ribA/ribD-fused uncharacterized protein
MPVPLSLTDLLNSGETFPFHFFWSGPFSQWAKSVFTVDNHYFCCEQFMMFKKAELFNDINIMQEILESSNPKEIKALGRKVSNFDSKIWNEHKRDIVFQGNFAKFSQNQELKDMLLNTRGTILVEASPYDNIWGVGLEESDSRINSPQTWKGENLLGFALTEVREYLLEHQV